MKTKFIFSIYGLIFVASLTYAADNNASEENLYLTCSTEKIFCCGVNGVEKHVVLQEHIWGEYNYSNAKAYCEKTYQETIISHNSDEEDEIDEDQIKLNEISATVDPLSAEGIDFP